LITRILVTGSRDWDRPEAIEYALRYLTELKDVADDCVLVSGACPTGADKMAEDIWQALGYTVERHPADWDTHGKKAGFLRNAEMVNLGADQCLAFIKNKSKGATMCADLAEKTGIPTYRYLMERKESDGNT
jgi:hypothetical protein